MKNIFRIRFLFTGILLVILLASCQDTSKKDPPLQLGQTYAGGLIFYIDGTGQHGLVCAPYDQSNAAPWCPGSPVLTNATNIPVGQGQPNTTLIVNVQGSAGYYAARMCDTLTLGGYTDWFLPSRDEIGYMSANVKSMGIGNFANAPYWCSTEFDAGTATTLDFGAGGYSNHPKTDLWHVRAARAF